MDQSGAIAAYAAIALGVFLGFAALTVDIGRIAVVQSELQKAADAGALAGAKALGVGTLPSWDLGQAAATSTVQLNSAAGALLTDCTPTSGYWSTVSHTLQANTITPLSTDLPAIQVVVAKNAGKNGGPLQLSFAPILGMNTHNLNGTAVAIRIFTGGSSGGGGGTGGGWGILEIGSGNINISGSVAVNGNVGVNGAGQVKITGSSGITGNLWVNGTGGIDLEGSAYVNGRLWDNGSGIFSMSGSAKVQGVAYLDNALSKTFGWSTTINGHTAQNNGSGFQSGDINPDASGAVAAVQPYAQAALTAYADFSTRAATSGTPTIIKSVHAAVPITGAGGVTTVVNLTSLNLSGDAILTLTAPETGSFIINVSGNGSSDFSVTGGAQIKLAGGLTADNVTFVNKGTAPVNILNGTKISGSILSPNADINFSGDASYSGTLVGGKNITLTGSVHSPQNLPWLVGSVPTTSAHLVQ